MLRVQFTAVSKFTLLIGYTLSWVISLLIHMTLQLSHTLPPLLLSIHTHTHTHTHTHNIKVNLWDTGGIERYRGPLSANYYRHCNAIILVYRQGDQQSLVALGEWSNDCKSYCLMKDQVMLSLWENVDNEAPSLDEHLVKDFMEHNGIPSTLRFKVCTKTGHSVKEAFESVIRTLDDRCTRVGLGQSDEMQQHYIDLKTLGRPSDAVSTSSDKATCHC